MFEAIGNIFKAAAAFFGYRQQRDAEQNAPDVKAAAVAATEVKETDAEAKATANKDLEKTREELSE